MKKQSKPCINFQDIARQTKFQTFSFFDDENNISFKTCSRKTPEKTPLLTFNC